MSVALGDLELYGSQRMPEADAVQVGGAVDFTICPYFSDLSANDTVDWVSSSSGDTAVKAQVSGRDATGTIQTPVAITLTGQTKVVGAQTFQRLLCGIITGSVAGSFPLTNPGGSTAVGDVACLRHTASISAHTAQAGAAATSSTPATITLQAGDGAVVSIGWIIQTIGGTGPNQLRRIIGIGGALGTDVVAVNRGWGTVPDATTTYNINQGMLFPILPNPITKVTRLFATAAAAGSARYFYEKIFVVNNNTATNGTGANVGIAGMVPLLGAGELVDLALTTALNDTNSCNPRQQASGFIPTGVGSFVTQPAQILVPSPGTLPAGAAPNTAGAQGMWARLTVPVGGAAYNGMDNFQLNCQTT